MRILITGGGGLIGQAIAKRHMEVGDSVYIYDTRVNIFNDYSNMVGNDITKKYKTLGKLLEAVQPDIISHQASLVGVGQSQYMIEEYVKNNVTFTSQLLQAMIDTGVLPKLFIHAGSMGPYGDTVMSPIHEVAMLRPVSVYGVTKAAQEELIRVFSAAYGVPAISLRYFSVYSTDQTPLNPYTGVLSVTGNKFINDVEIRLYDDGEQIRDLIHVKDVAEAHFKASRLENHMDFVAVNIGTGVGHTINYVASKMKETLMSAKNIVHTNTIRSGDIRNAVADISRAKVLLDWEPTITLEESIKEYCDFLAKNWDKYKMPISTNTVETDNLVNRGLIK